MMVEIVEVVEASAAVVEVVPVVGVLDDVVAGAGRQRKPFSVSILFLSLSGLGLEMIDEINETMICSNTYYWQICFSIPKPSK